jgi:hypothetical protein
VLVLSAEDAERNRDRGVKGESRQTVEELSTARFVFRPRCRLQREFEDASSFLGQDTDELADFLPRSKTGGDGSVVGSLMVRTTRRSKAGGTAAKSLTEMVLHLDEIVFGGFVLEGAFAHGPCPQGGVANVGGIVDPLWTAVDRVQILGKSLPGPVDACIHRDGRNVLGPFQVPND